MNGKITTIIKNIKAREKNFKNRKYKKWVEKKKKLLEGKKFGEDLSDFMYAGIESINEYLD